MGTKKDIGPEKKFIPIHDSEGHYVRWSSKCDQTETSVVLFHGDMRTSRNFDSVSKKLSLTNNVYAYDFLGHGDSDWPGRKYKFSERSKEIINLIQFVSGKTRVGAGHSNGAVALVLAALENPTSFHRLILMDPMLVVDESFQQMVSKRANRDRRTWESFEDLKQTLTSHPLTKNWDAEVIDDVVENETFQSNCRIDIKWDRMTMTWERRNGDYLNILEMLPKLEMPVLLVISEGRQKEYLKVDQSISKNGRF
jgi:pimeloyl-ACP methyl ester carboxylesterase